MIDIADAYRELQPLYAMQAEIARAYLRLCARKLFLSMTTTKTKTPIDTIPSKSIKTKYTL